MLLKSGQVVVSVTEIGDQKGGTLPRGMVFILEVVKRGYTTYWIKHDKRWIEVADYWVLPIQFFIPSLSDEDVEKISIKLQKINNK